MQAGIITEENLSQILRGISQKRRHGVLELHAGERVLEISFFQGKIVNLCDQGKSLARSVAERFVRRETIYAHPWIETIDTVHSLAEQLSLGGEDVAPELLALVVSQQALETLYTLRLESGSYYHFRVEVVAAPTDLDLQLSVGQLLLDLVALKDDRTAISRAISDDMIIARGIPQEREYSLEEQDLIWLVDGEMTVAQLRARSLLNSPTFDDTLYGLINEGVLERQDAPDSTSPPLFDMGALDASIDRYVDEALKESDVVDETVPEVRVARAIPQSKTMADVGKPTPAVKVPRLAQWNEKLLANPAIPNAMVFVVCAAACAVPLLLWL